MSNTIFNTDLSKSRNEDTNTNNSILIVQCYIKNKEDVDWEAFSI